jgi:hypothetical protein
MRNKQPLSVTITQDGVLTIEIGIDTLAFAALYSEHAWKLAGEDSGKPTSIMPDKLLKVTDKYGFATDVLETLKAEAEDGSSLLTEMLDAAAQKAIEDGSEFFLGIDEEP